MSRMTRKQSKQEALPDFSRRLLPSVERRQRRRGLLALFVTVGGLQLLGSRTALAQTLTYNSANAPGTFSSGFGLATSATGSTTTTLDFGGTAYTATDNLTNAFSLNALTFSNSGAVTLARGSGAANNQLTFVSNGGTTPTVALNNTGSLTVGLDLALNALTTFSGTGSATFSGVVSGTGGLTKNGSGNLTLSGANTFSGTTTIRGGTLTLGNSLALQNSTLNYFATTLSFGSLTSATFGGLTGSTSLALTNASSAAVALTVGGNNTDQTFSGTLSGTGSLTKAGTGTLILLGFNTSYSGGTTISAGTLQIGNGDTHSGIGTGSVLDNASLVFNRSAAYTYSGVISGTGSLTQAGSSTLILSGANTYSGGTTVSSGTLQIGAGSATGSVSGNIVNNAAVSFNRTDSPTYSGIISGTGSVTQSGTGTLTLTGANTYSGVTTISAGTLQIGSGATGSITGDIVDNAILQFNRSDALTYGGSISGVGSLTKLGAGTLTLTGADTRTGTATISAGTLQIGSGGTTGSIAGNITDNAALTFSRSDALTYSGNITGTGSLTQVGTGTLTLTGTNTYTGGTTVSGGTLQIGSGGTTGSISGNILNNSAVVFSRSDNSTYSGIMSGTGTVTKTGAGILYFNNANTYTGLTTISAGQIQFQNGADIAGDIADNSFFAFVRSDTYTYGGLISGTGGVGQSGSGKITLTNANTYKGLTSINGVGGTLILGNSLAVQNSTVFLQTAGANLSFGTLTSATFENLTGNLASQILTLTNTSSLPVALTLGGNNSSTIFSGVIAGSGSLTKTGTGTLTLASANTYSGDTTISAGTLTLGNSLALQNSTLIYSSGTLSFGTLTAATLGGLSGSQNIALTNTSSSAVALTVKDTGTDIYSGALSGAGSLTLNGTGTLTLTGANTYTGATTIAAGALTIANANAIQNSTLNYAAGTFSFGSLTNATFGGLSGSQNLTLANASSAAVALTVGGNNVSTTFTGGISGSGSLVKNGTRVLTLTGALTYSGGTTVNAGSIQVGTGGNIVGDVTNNSTLAFNRSDTYTYSGNISGTGNVVQSGPGTLTLTGQNSYSGGTNINGGTLVLGSAAAVGTSGSITFGGGTLQYTSANLTDYSSRFNSANPSAISVDTNGQNVTYASAIGSGSTGGLTKSGAGTLTLSGTNAYTGGTTIGGGTLAVSSAASLGSGTVSLGGGTLLVNSATTLSNAVTLGSSAGLSSGTVTTGNVHIPGLGLSGRVTLNSATNATSLNVTGSSRVAITGSVGEATGQTTSLTKTGSGTLELDEDNTYTGGTLIAGGTLVVNNNYAAGGFTASGSGTGEGAVTVGRGATLTGAYAISGPVQVNSGGTLAVGNSIGVGEVSALNLAGGSLLDFEVGTDGVTSDRVNIGSLLSRSGTGGIGFALTGEHLTDGTINPMSVGTFTLLTFGAQNGLSAGDFFTSGLPTGWTSAFTLTNSHGSGSSYQSGALSVTLSQIGSSAAPEPTALLLLLPGALVGAAGIRRRRLSVAVGVTQ